MKKYILIAIGFMFLLLLLGCELPECDEDSIMKPIPVSPTGEIIITDPSPDLVWSNPGLCTVSGYTVTVGTNGSAWTNSVFHDDFPGDVTTATSEVDYLDDCTTYYWEIRTWAPSTYNVSSNLGIFKTDFTGSCPPVESCDGAPGKPILHVVDGSGNNPQLVWEPANPYCAVENYHYEVADSALFTNLLLEGDTTATSVESDTPYLPDDCQYYFYRVTAEANGESTPSDIGIIHTMFTGGCAFYGCTDAAIVAPVLVEPQEGEVVGEARPQFVWSYDTDACTPHGWEIYVSELEDLSWSLFHYTWTGNTSWTPISDVLQDCTDYYWAVYAISEGRDTVVPSETGSFSTNFFGICPIELNTRLPEFLEQIPLHLPNFGLGCVSSSQMWAMFEFDVPIKGDFEVRLGNLRWPCQLMQGFNNKLLCYGPLAGEGRNMEVQLFDLDNNQLVLTNQGVTPFCVQAQICQPPAEGCSPIITYDAQKNRIYIPTFWDTSQCKCVPR